MIRFSGEVSLAPPRSLNKNLTLEMNIFYRNILQLNSHALAVSEERVRSVELWEKVAEHGRGSIDCRISRANDYSFSMHTQTALKKVSTHPTVWWR